MNRELSLEINKLCNFRCGFCYTEKHKENLPDISEVFRLIDEGIEEGVTSLSMTGGEPLLQPDRVLAIASFAKERGLRIRLNTNGFFLSKSNFAERLMPVIDEFQVSFNAVNNDGFASYTGLGKHGLPFDVVLRNIITLKRRLANVTIRFTLDHQTRDDLIGVYLLFAGRSAAFETMIVDQFKVRTVRLIPLTQVPLYVVSEAERA